MYIIISITFTRNGGVERGGGERGAMVIKSSKLEEERGRREGEEREGEREGERERVR